MDDASRYIRRCRQERVAEWVAAAFGLDHLQSLPQRGIRLLEEAAEAAQAAGCTREMCLKLVNYVFDHPAGELKQELGGVGMCVLALGAAAGIDADEAEQAELERVLAKPLEHFAARNKVKNDAGFEATGAPGQKACRHGAVPPESCLQRLTRGCVEGDAAASALGIEARR